MDVWHVLQKRSERQANLSEGTVRRALDRFRRTPLPEDVMSVLEIKQNLSRLFAR